MIDPRQAEIERLTAALQQVERALQVPAAEYVPAIRDAWDIIDRALGRPHWSAREAARAGPREGGGQ